MKVLQENIPQTSFRHKIILISLVAMMIMLAATTVVWYYNTAQEARKSAERYIGNVLQQSNDTFETMVRGSDRIGESIRPEQFAYFLYRCSNICCWVNSDNMYNENPIKGGYVLRG